MDRLVRDGKVAVIYSPGFGAGWSSWARGEADPLELIFDPKLAEMVDRKNTIHADRKNEAAWHEVRSAIFDYVKERWPKIYNGGVIQLQVEWVPQGRRFRIDEYDGSESVVLDDEDDWRTA